MTTKPETSRPIPEEERLAHGLVSRGLVTAEEIQQCITADGAGGAELLLNRLVKAGYLTSHQARRAAQEISMIVGQQIPGYQLLEKLGEGSMGTVFKARQLSMNRAVAIKVLQPRLAASPSYIERFNREARLAAKLSHNNVVQAIDVGSAGKIHFFIMEFVEGTTIEQQLNRGKVYEEREAVDIILQIAGALEHAHRRDLIHRDIKPANIMLTKEKVGKLADLGLARETEDRALSQAEKGLTIGTPYYIAPEQIGGREKLDGQADIYSLGATFYHMVTGQPPFPGTQVEAVLRAHLNKELTPPDHLNTKLSSGVGEVIELMMAKDRRQRYRSAADLILDLECLLAGEAPKLARTQIESSRKALGALSKGEAEDDEEDMEEEPDPESSPSAWLWVGILGALLAGSVILNLIQLVMRG